MLKSKRPYCQTCHYPMVTCVCSAITHVQLPIEVTVIQHKQETNHPKNTIRLASLVSPSIEVFRSDLIDDITQHLDSLDKQSTLVVYPSPASEPLESYSDQKHTITTVVLLDGTWGQAFALWNKFELLKSFRNVHFEQAPEQQYRMRKSKKQYQLSSIEALAYTLNTIVAIDSQPYLNALQCLNKHWTRQGQ